MQSKINNIKVTCTKHFIKALASNSLFNCEIIIYKVKCLAIKRNIFYIYQLI